MARYADEGASVLVVTLTGGERGDILNPAMDLPEVHGRIHEIRSDEMAKAAEILGVEHHWLGFVDSGLPEGDPPPPLPEGCFALVPLEVPTEAPRPRDPRVQAARDDHLRRERRLSASGPHPMPRGLDGRLRGGRRLPAVPRCRRAVECAKLYYNHGFLRQRMQVLQDEFAKTRRGGSVRQVARALGSRRRSAAQAGDHPHRVLEVLRPARRRPARACHSDRPERASSSPRRWNGSNGYGRQRNSSWPGRGCRSGCPRPICSRGSSRR